MLFKFLFSDTYKNYTYRKVAPPVPDASPRPPPPLRIELFGLVLFPHKTLAKNTRAPETNARKRSFAKKLRPITALSTRSGEDNCLNDLTKSKSLRRVVRRLIFDTKKNDFHCGERAESTLLLSGLMKSIRNKKLSDSSKVKDPAAGGNESQIFQIAPDSCHFGNESRQSPFLKS